MTVPEIHPDRLRIEALIACCEKRVGRAGEKLTAARIEDDRAAEALRLARDKLADWITANPDPQMELI